MRSATYDALVIFELVEVALASIASTAVSASLMVESDVSPKLSNALFPSSAPAMMAFGSSFPETTFISFVRSCAFALQSLSALVPSPGQLEIQRASHIPGPVVPENTLEYVVLNVFTSSFQSAEPVPPLHPSLFAQYPIESAGHSFGGGSSLASSTS